MNSFSSMTFCARMADTKRGQFLAYSTIAIPELVTVFRRDVYSSGSPVMPTTTMVPLGRTERTHTHNTSGIAQGTESISQP